MANTHIHKQKGKFNQGISKDIPRRLQRYFDRYNFEVGYFREIRLRLIEKQADNDMQIELDGNNIQH